MIKTIREWDEIEVRSEGIDKKIAGQLCELAAHESKRLKVSTPALSWKNRTTLKAGQVIGVLALPSFSLEILPKIEGENDTRVREALTHMLNIAWGLPVVTSTNTSMGLQNHDLLEVLITSFAEKFLTVVRRGLPRRYVPFEDELTLLRGRLNVKRQIVNNLVRPDKLACEFDELSVDTPLNRVLKATVRLLESHARSAENRRRLLELRARLESVSNSALPLSERVRLDRTNTVFHELYRLAQLLLQRPWQSTNIGTSSGIALLFPMNDLFEAFVARSLKRALPARDIRIQDSGKFVLSDGTKRLMHLKPDLVMDGDTIIDTKWKRLDAEKSDLGVKEADVYQMLAYGHAYKAKRLILLYPWHQGLERDSIQNQKPWNVHGTEMVLDIATVDIGVPKDVPATLKEMFPDSWL